MRISLIQHPIGEVTIQDAIALLGVATMFIIMAAVIGILRLMKEGFMLSGGYGTATFKVILHTVIIKSWDGATLTRKRVVWDA